MFFLSRSSILIAVCSAGLFAHGEDWPHFLGPTWNLHSTETNLDLDFPVEGPKKLWEFPKGKGHAGPVVMDDHVILFHQVDKEEVIHCLDARTGKVKWKHSYPVQVDQSYGITDTPRSSPTIDVETRTVYTLGNDGDLIAFHLKNGKISWKIKLREKFGEAPFFFGQGSAPLVHKDKLIVHVGSPEACVVALNKKNGKVIWKAPHQWNGSYASPIIAEINEQEKLMVFAGGKVKPPHGGLICMDPEDGTVHDSFSWRSTNFASVNAATPVPCGPNRVFITEDYGKGGVMLRYDSDFSSRVEWTSQDFGCQFQTPIYHDGILYGFGGNGGLMLAFNVFSGTHLWNQGFFQTTIPWEGRDIPMSLGHAHMIHIDEGFLCLGENGSLIRFHLTPGGPMIRSKARLFYAPETWAPPVISNGRLFVNQNELESRLICYDVSKK